MQQNKWFCVAALFFILFTPCKQISVTHTVRKCESNRCKNLYLNAIEQGNANNRLL